ncbi:hypothetical protein [Streptosporangium sp. V21-05]|uniref:hypothetical protein n=1 Tax=Streptosporangium sp. V21-05 TaxID=3446115 RepID=UPI003F537C5A
MRTPAKNTRQAPRAGHPYLCGAVGGLFQRISITVGFCWVSALAVHLMRAPRGSVPARPA